MKLEKIVTPIKTLSLFTVACTLAFAANFAYGQWSNPTATPPDINVAIPINGGGVQQEKTGNLKAAEFHSDNYCDSVGGNCVAASSLGGGGAQSGVVDKGSASRSSSYTVWVAFDTPFTAPPAVLVSPKEFTSVNECRSDNTRFSVRATNITQYGFTMFMSSVGSCGGYQHVNMASWIAVP
jgi:hypothetical protein